jgi:hypothetical protein
MEGCTGRRYIAEEMAKAGVDAHLAEPADTSALRGRKRRAKTDKADAKLLRELLAQGRLPECYIPPAQVLEWRALLELYQDLRSQHTSWAQRIQAVCFHRGTTAPGQAGIVRGDRARLRAIVDEQLTVSGRLQVNTALAIMDVLADHLERLRRRLLSTARGVNGARALMHDIYGVGPLSSLALCVWLGGAARFSSSRKAVRFVGLDITVHSSDGRRSPGTTLPPRPRSTALATVRSRENLRPHLRARLRLLHPGQRPLRRQPGLPLASPPDRPARHAHPDRPRRRRVHHHRPAGRTNDHRPLTRCGTLKARTGSPTSAEDGHQSRPVPSAPLSDRATTATAEAVTTDGQERLSGRTPAGGHPINHHVADTNPSDGHR